MFGEDALLEEACGVAERRTAWAGYAVYGRQRLAGLRPAALETLNGFLDQACAWPFEERRDFCHWLGGLAGSLLYGPRCPEPLWRRLMAPTLLEWAAREPDSAEAHLALGARSIIDGDPLTPEQHLHRALELDPACDRARILLTEIALSDAEYAQHHLPDHYIGDPADDLARLDEAQALVEAGGPSPERTRQLAEITELRAAALDWIGRSKAP